MKTSKETFYIITGGPGVGKTTLINELNNLSCYLYLLIYRSLHRFV